MKRAFLLAWLTAHGALAQTLPIQKQMRQILENLAQARPKAEQQIDWEHLQIAKARNLPEYSRLNANEQAAFRKAVLTTLRPHLENLLPRQQGNDYYLERPGLQYRFQQTPQGLKLTGIL